MNEAAPSQTAVSLLSSFQIHGLIGEGEFGKVLMVTKTDTQKIYAMKVMRKADVLKRNQV